MSSVCGHLSWLRCRLTWHCFGILLCMFCSITYLESTFKETISFTSHKDIRNVKIDKFMLSITARCICMTVPPCGEPGAVDFPLHFYGS